MIEDHVLANNEGSMACNRDILADAIAAGLISDRKEGILFEDENFEKMYRHVMSA